MMEKIFSPNLKMKLLVYMTITGISFAYLVLADLGNIFSGISVLVFVILQSIMLSLIVEEKKRLLWMIPIAVLAMNSFLSANMIWRIPNIILCIVLYSLMFTKIDFKDTSYCAFLELAERMFAPLLTVNVPFNWCLEATKGKRKAVKSAVIAVVLSLVSVSMLCMVLSGADMVFDVGISRILDRLFNVFDFKFAVRCIGGICIGLYLFGVAAASFFDFEHDKKGFGFKGDVIIISTVMVSTLFVYTVFAFIQFRYLFSGSDLPFGLNVTEYARRGFFELLALTGVNIAAILTVVGITRHVKGKLSCFIKGLNMYLCAVTVILLVSSFYRMLMYNETDGLTRLRFLVFGFLIFELIGLIATFVYIAKPEFNIVIFYCTVALCYYLVLNVVPMDAIVAKSQVDRYLNGKRSEINYVVTLSPDAAKEVYRAYCYSSDSEVKKDAEKFLDTMVCHERDWRGFNMACEKARRIQKLK